MCQLCPAGFFCSDPTILPIPCFPGTYAAPGAIECSTCPIGFYCPHNATQMMVQCPTGMYANETGQLLCRNCPEGYECQVASQQPELCRRGTFSSGGVSSCSLCPSGYFTNYTGATECEVCPEGHACPVSSNQPIGCPAGTYRYTCTCTRLL